MVANEWEGLETSLDARAKVYEFEVDETPISLAIRQ